MSVKEKLQDILGINFFNKEDLEEIYNGDDVEPNSYYEEEEEAYDEETGSGYEEPQRSSWFNFGGSSSRRERRTEREYTQNQERYEPYQRETYTRNRFGRSNSYEEREEERRPSPVQMVLVKAKRFLEVERIAENLRQHRSVIINFDEMDKVDAQRTIDFLSGVTFALKGSVQKVSKCTIVFAVGQVDLVGRIEEMSREQEGVFSMF